MLKVVRYGVLHRKISELCFEFDSVRRILEEGRDIRVLWVSRGTGGIGGLLRKYKRNIIVHFKLCLLCYSLCLKAIISLSLFCSTLYRL
jgi:hypothetical protein